jgi:hypothetical protein
MPAFSAGIEASYVVRLVRPGPRQIKGREWQGLARDRSSFPCTDAGEQSARDVQQKQKRRSPSRKAVRENWLRLAEDWIKLAESVEAEEARLERHRRDE